MLKEYVHMLQVLHASNASTLQHRLFAGVHSIDVQKVVVGLQEMHYIFK